MTEATQRESQFRDKNDNVKMQDVAKIKLDGKPDPLNINVNRASIDALVDAFGEESKDWVGKPLTLQTDKVSVAGRRVTAIYLIPDGYELTEDEGGYVKIVNPAKVASSGDSEIDAVNGDLQEEDPEDVGDPL